MKEIERTAPVSDMGVSLQAQAADLLKSHLGLVEASQGVRVAPAQPAAESAPAKGLLAKAMSALGDLVKSQVKGYTRKDGAYVADHTNKVQKKAKPAPGADRQAALDAYAPKRKEAGAKGQAALDAYAKAVETAEVDLQAMQQALEALKAGKDAHEAAGEAARAIPHPGDASPWEHHDERAAALGDMHQELQGKVAKASKKAKPKAGKPDAGAQPGAETGNPGSGDVSRGATDEPGAGAAGAGQPDAGAQPSGELPPQADAKAAGWGELPDDENPQHALGGMGSKDLGALATMKPEHAKAHAHAELANRGQDANGNWQGFDKAKAGHAGSIPKDFTPHPGVADGMQAVKGKVLQAAAGGHLDLQKRARAHLAGRGHDVNGSWVGFDKANELHGVDGKTGQPPAKPGKKKPAGGDLAKSLAAGERPMLFVSNARADALQASIARVVGGKS